MSTTKITKAVLKDDIFLYVEYSEDMMDGHGTKEWAGTLTIPAHKDLLNEFKKLDGHLAMICDELTVKGLEKEIDKYSNRGFSLKGEDTSQGVTLMGGKKTKHGYVNLNTPFQRFETSSYAGIGELAIQIEACKHEVDQYLFHGKRAPDPQMTMDFEAKQDGQDDQAGLDDLAQKAVKSGKEKKEKGKTEAPLVQMGAVAEPGIGLQSEKKVPKAPRKKKPAVQEEF